MKTVFDVLFSIFAIYVAIHAIVFAAAIVFGILIFCLDFGRNDIYYYPIYLYFYLNIIKKVLYHLIQEKFHPLAFHPHCTE